MVVDLVLAAAVFTLAGVLMINKGNFSVTIVHRTPKEEIQRELQDVKKNVLEEMSKEEVKFYKESESVISEINRLLYGEEEETDDGTKEIS